MQELSYLTVFDILYMVHEVNFVLMICISVRLLLGGNARAVSGICSDILAVSGLHGNVWGVRGFCGNLGNEKRLQKSAVTFGQ